MRSVCSIANRKRKISINKSSYYIFYRSPIESASLDLYSNYAVRKPQNIHQSILLSILAKLINKHDGLLYVPTRKSISTNTYWRRRGKGWQQGDWWEDDAPCTKIIRRELFLHHWQFIKTAIRRLAMFSTTKDTGKKCDYPDNNKTTSNTRYFQTFTEPSLIKASTTEGYLWKVTSLSAIHESLSHRKSTSIHMLQKNYNQLFHG
jgi:hypothetical protein